MQDRREPELVETPCLSSAKRRMRIWIFEPMDIGIVAGVLVFGQHLVSIPKCLIFCGAYTIFIAFYKFGKPAGYVIHQMGYQLRYKRLKPGKRKAIRRFFDPDEEQFNEP